MMLSNNNQESPNPEQESQDEANRQSPNPEQESQDEANRQSPNPEQVSHEEAHRQLLEQAGEKLQRENDARAQLSDVYQDALDKAERAIGTPAEEQARSDAAQALVDYSQAVEKYDTAIQLVKDLMDLLQ